MSNHVAVAVEQGMTDLLASNAKREAAAARIRANRQLACEGIAEKLAAHLADHGAETETDGADFLKETA